MRISDWSSDVCSSDLAEGAEKHGPGDGHDHAHANFLGPNTELIFALACGALLAIGFAIEKLVAGAPDWLPTAFYVGAYVFGGFFTLREAIDNLKLKKFEIDRSEEHTSELQSLMRISYA